MAINIIVDVDERKENSMTQESDSVFFSGKVIITPCGDKTETRLKNDPWVSIP